MEFRKYTSIKNSYRQKTIDHIVSCGYSGGEWIATEKIHGANFSFYYDGKDIKCAKRSGWVGEEENFYGHKHILKKYSGAVLTLFNSLERIEFPDLEYITVRGEICGGSGDGFSQVQKGVYYSDEVEFIAFDLEVGGKPMHKQFSRSLMFTAGFNIVPMLGIGSFQTALGIPEEFDSLISNRENNIAEGIVIEPVKPAYLACGSRVILKKKAKWASEKNEKKPKVGKETHGLSPEQAEVIETIDQYFTENRLKNVLSKIGEVTSKDFGKIMGAFVQDALGDAVKEEGRDFKEELGDGWKRISKLINNNASVLIRRNFLNIIDGTF